MRDDVGLKAVDGRGTEKQLDSRCPMKVKATVFAGSLNVGYGREE